MADQPKKRSKSNISNSAELSDQVGTNRTTDGDLAGDIEPIESTVDRLGASRDKNTSDQSGSEPAFETVNGVGGPESVASTQPNNAELEAEFLNVINSQRSQVVGEADHLPENENDAGIDLLAASTYPDGSARLGPEESAELFDSLEAEQPSDEDFTANTTTDSVEQYDSAGFSNPTDDGAPEDELQRGNDFSGNTERLDNEILNRSEYEQIPPDSEQAFEEPTDWIDESKDPPVEESELDSEELVEVGSQDFDENIDIVQRAMLGDTDQSPLIEEGAYENQSVELAPDPSNVDEASEAVAKFDQNSNLAAQAYGWAEVDELEDGSSNDSGFDDAGGSGSESIRSEAAQSSETEQSGDQQKIESGASTAQASVLTYDNMLEEDEQMRWFTIGMPIVLVTIIVILGGYVYSLQSQIDDIRTLMSAEDDDYFAEDREDGSAPIDSSALAHVNSRIDNLAASVEAIANRSAETGAVGSEGSAPSSGLLNLNKDLAILAERLKTVEQKLASQKTPPRIAVQRKAAKTSKPQSKKSTQTVSRPNSQANTAKRSDIWSVNLMSVTEKTDAEKQLKGFRQKGVAAEIEPKMISGKQWYRIQVTGFDSKKEAKEYAVQVKNKLGLASVWVTR